MTDGESYVDPRAPRFGQALTATALFAGIVLEVPLVVYTVAVVLIVAVATGWRLDLYAVLWRSLRPFVGSPAEREPAAPHRFAKLLGATGSALASGLLLAGLDIAGYAVAAGVGIAAGLAATTGVCLGCQLYRQVGTVRRLGLV